MKLTNSDETGLEVILVTVVGDIKDEIREFALKICSWRCGLADGKDCRWSNGPLVSVCLISIIDHGSD